MRKPHTKRLRHAATRTVLALATLGSASASFLSGVQPRQLAAQTASNASALVTAASNTAGQRPGRFGHGSVYLAPPVNKLVLFGGQLASNDSTVHLASDALVFNVASTMLYDDDRPVSAIPDNPAPSDEWSTTLDPTAFAAAAVQYNEGLVWTIGGVKLGAPDACPSDASVVRSFNFTSNAAVTGWTTAEFEPRLPPRRRQAQLVPVTNLTTLSTDLWVFGGIADEYSCSSTGSTVGYVGIDRYSTKLGEVESMAWTDPVNATTTGQQPISDYSAQLLQDGSSIVVIGGQTAEGELVGLDQVLVFNVELREWYTKTPTGDVAPSARMGHVSVPLESGSILVHGGLSAAHSPLSDLHLLVPPSLSHLSQFSPSSDNNTNSTTTAATQTEDRLSWEWKTLVISDDSMTSPALAYHGASEIVGGTIVVSFGLDGNDSTTMTTNDHASNKLWFLTVDESAGTYSWKDTFEGNAADVALELATGKTLSKRLSVEPLGGGGASEEFKAMVKRVEVIANPKAYSTLVLDHSQSSTASSTSPVQTGAGGGWSNGDNNGGSETAMTSSPPSVASSSSTRSVVVSSPSTSPLAPNVKQNSSSSNSTTIGASVGGTLGALALLSLAVVLVRRRAAARSRDEFSGPMTPDMTSNATFGGAGGTGGRGASGAPLVSSLMYTRPVQRRMLSLGSTISELPGEHDDDNDEGGVDPFSDEYNVNEHGQLARSSSNATVRGGAATLARSKSSVTSIPFLSTITRDPALASPAFSHSQPSPVIHASKVLNDDVYTSPAPTLSSRRSLRRPSQHLPPMPVPGTPAELIGLAVTSDDGHEAALTGVPYRSAAAPAKTLGGGGGQGESGWETFLQNPPPPPVPSTQAGRGGSGGEGIPAVLRPATPLRVRNADPFADH